jgi:hypothetical protein
MWTDWRAAFVLVQPDTVGAWHRPVLSFKRLDRAAQFSAHVD